MDIYIDIETIPAQSQTVCDEIAANVSCPGNITKAESIAAWERDKKPAAVAEAISKTALDGAYGHVCCIGLAINDGPAFAYTIEKASDEARMVEAALASVNYSYRDGPLTIVGHNVVNFDIRFLWQRAIILGVRMPDWFPRDPKPWGNDVFDTMTAFAGQRGTIGMDRLSKAMGLPGKGDIDGSMIGQLWADGEYDRIDGYCRADVERTRQIHKRMQIAFGQAPASLEAAQ